MFRPMGNYLKDNLSESEYNNNSTNDGEDVTYDTDYINNNDKDNNIAATPEFNVIKSRQQELVKAALAASEMRQKVIAQARVKASTNAGIAITNYNNSINSNSVNNKNTATSAQLVVPTKTKRKVTTATSTTTDVQSKTVATSTPAKDAPETKPEPKIIKSTRKVESQNKPALTPSIGPDNDESSSEGGSDDDSSNSDGDDENMDITWKDVFQVCCVHSPRDWARIAFMIFGVCFFLYFFMFALELLSQSAKVLTGCSAGALFDDDANPVAALMIGIISTALVQSSSTTTSIIVSLVGGGVVSVQQGIYMVMGANIGTTITNTIVAMGQVSSDGVALELAFAGATVHDMFNFMTVAILLPLEVATGYLEHLTSACVKRASDTNEGTAWEGPIYKFVSPLGRRIVLSNTDLLTAIAHNEGSCSDGDGFYPIICEGEPSYENCKQVGLIKCDKKSGQCPAFFSADASATDDKVSGGVTFFISFCILFICLLGLVYLLQMLMMHTSAAVLYKATSMNGYFAILVGAGLTVVVQSSSVVTSTLTPLVGVGVLSIDQMYPLTLGSNIGTTVTAIMAAMVTEGTAPLQVALAHLFYNVTGVLIFYPIPFMRQLPIGAAKRLGKITRLWLGFPVVYIAVMFFLMPLLFIGISELFQKHSKGYTVMGSFLSFIVVFCLLYTIYWFRYRGGSDTCYNYITARERRRVAMRDLPGEMEFLNVAVKGLMDHTGFVLQQGNNGDLELKFGDEIRFKPVKMGDNNHDEDNDDDDLLSDLQ